MILQVNADFPTHYYKHTLTYFTLFHYYKNLEKHLKLTFLTLKKEFAFKSLAD